MTSGLRCSLRLRRVPILIQQEVEPAHLVRAVVRAVARADAAVVDHVVQAFVVVDGRGHRADHLARRVLALLAGHRLVIGVGVLEVAGVVAVDPQPVHLAAVEDLLLADHRNVVLGLAGDDAGVAAGADVLVDGHAPGVALVLEVAVHRQPGQRLVLHLLREPRIFGELRLGRHANQVASFERPVILRGRELVASRRSWTSSTPGRVSRAAVVRSGFTLKPVPLPARPARVRPYPRCSVSVSGAWPGASHTGMRIDRSPCRSSTTSPLIKGQARGRRRRDQRRVVPGELRQRLRQLLQPRVVGETAVVDAGIGPEHDFEALCGRRARRRLPPGSPGPPRVRVGNAVSGTRPSCSHLRHSRSNGESCGTGAAAIGAGTGGAGCPPGAAAGPRRPRRRGPQARGQESQARGQGAEPQPQAQLVPAWTAPSRATRTRVRPRTPSARDPRSPRPLHAPTYRRRAARSAAG